MSNSLVAQYRSLQPNDPRTDDQLTQLFGAANEKDGQFNQFHDFVADYQRLSNPASQMATAHDLPPSVATEFGKALQEGGESLKQSATGLGALIASAGGWDSLKTKLLQSYQQQTADSAENAPAIPNLQDIKSPQDFALYLAAKAGGLVPQLGEAAVFAGAGALAGSAVGPEGTAAGGVAGLAEGFLGRAAAKSLLKTGIEKIAKDSGWDAATSALVKSQLEKVAAKEAVGAALGDTTKALLTTEAKAIAKNYGATGANLLNFYGQGVGSTYGQLANQPGVSEGDAQAASAIAGAGSAAGVLLPHYITSRLFPGVGKEVADSYLKRLVTDAAKEVPVAASGMGLMEVASIAAEKYADPKKRNEGWTDDDTSRLLNALAVGGGLGAIASPLTALKGPAKFDPAVEQHFADVPPDRRSQIEALKGRLMAGSPNQADITAERTLSPGERAYYAVAKEIPLQEQTVEQVNQTSPVAPPESPATIPTTPTPAPAVESPAAEATAPTPTAPVVTPKPGEALRAAAAGAMQSGGSTVADAARARIEAAAAKTETHPTVAQKIDESYKQGTVDGKDLGLPGFKVKIETVKGGERTGIGPDGKPWSVTMPTHYGKIEGTVGMDGQALDVYVKGPVTAEHQAYVIDQHTLDGKPDEHKVMLGFGSAKEAVDAYHAAFSDGKGKDRIGGILALSHDELNAWLKSDRTKEPMATPEAMADKISKMTGKEFADFKAAMPNGPQMMAESIGRRTKDPASLLLAREKATKEMEHAVANPPLPMTADHLEHQMRLAAKRQFFNEAYAQATKEPAPKFKLKESVVLPDGTKGVIQNFTTRGSKPEVASVLPEGMVHSIKNLINVETTKLKKGESHADSKQKAVEVGGGKQAGTAKEVAAGKPSEVLKPAEPSEASPKYKAPTGSNEPPKVETKTRQKIRAKLDEKAAKINDIKARMEALKKSKPLPEFKRPTGESGFVINPVEFKALDPEYLKLASELSKEVLSSGALKFADYAASMVEHLRDVLGEWVYPVIGHAYEAARVALKKEDPEAYRKLTPLNKMGDAIIEAATPNEARVYHPDYLIRPNDIDVESAGTADKSAKGGAGTKRVEPAFFVPTEKTESKLKDRLISQSSPPAIVDGKRPSNSLTHRLTAILDHETGQVHLVSTYENNGVVNFTKFTEDVGGKKGVTLRQVLDAKMADGESRFQVVGSTRTKDLNEYYHQIYPNRKSFREQFSNEVADRQKRISETGRIEEEKMQSTGVEQGAAAKAQREDQIAGAAKEGVDLTDKSVPESTTALTENKVALREGEHMGQTADEEPSPLDPHAPILTESKDSRINLLPHEVDELRKSLPGFATYDEFANIVESNHPPLPDGLYDVIEKSLIQDPHFFTRIFNNGLEETIKDHVNYGNDNATAGQPVEPRAPAPKEDNRPSPPVSGTERPGVPGGNVEPVRQDRTGAVTEPQGEQGNQIPGDTTGADQGGLKATAGENSNESAGLEDTQRFIDAARAAGINVKGVTSGAIRDAAKALGVTEDQLVGSGAINPTTRTIHHVLSDVTGKTATTPRVILHEVAHIAFRDESPEVQQRLIDATHRLTDEALGVDVSKDPRIRASDPANLGERAVNEERLVEATTLKMMREGFNSEEAKGFSQKFVRQLKDMYYRSVMATQRLLGFGENPELARRYFENRVRQLLAGDKVTSYLDFVNARALNISEKWNDHFNNGNILGERFNSDGQIVYDHADDLDSGGARFNTEKLKFTAGDKNDPEYEGKLKHDLEARVSVLNHLIDTLGSAAKTIASDPKIQEAATKAKMTPEKYLLRILRADDPRDEKADIANQRETGGGETGYDPEKKLEDFNGESTLGPNRRDAYQQVERLNNRAGLRIVKNNMDIGVLQKKVAALDKRNVAAKANLESLRSYKKDPNVSVPNLDKDLGKSEGVQEAISKKLSSTKARIERKSTENDALRKAMPAFESEKTRLGSKLGIGTEFEYGNNAIYNGGIEHPDMTDAEIIQKGKSGSVVTARELKMDKDGHVENPLELQKHLADMKAFLDYREAKDRAGDENALSSVYVGVKKQYEQIIANKDFTIRPMPAARLMWGLTMSPIGVRLRDAFGSHGAPIQRMWNDFTSVMESLHPTSETIWRKSIQLEKDLLNMVPGKFSHATLRKYILSPAMELWEHADDLANTHGARTAAALKAFTARVREQLLSNDAVGPAVRPVIDKFSEALVKKLMHNYESQSYYDRAVRTGAGVKGVVGIDVKDPSIKTTNTATGERETAVRKEIEIGLGAFSRRFSQHGSETAKALGMSGWAGFNQALEKFSAETTKDMTPEQRDVVAKLRVEGAKELSKLTQNPTFGAAVRNNFVGALMGMEERSPFLEPKKAGDLTESTADTEHMHNALIKSGFLQNGDLLKLADAVNEAHGLPAEGHAYAVQFLGTLGKIYDGVMKRMGEISKDPSRETGIEEMTPNALIDARVVRHLPGDWFDFHSFDQHDVFNQSQRIASELAFGRGQKGLYKKFQDLMGVVGESVSTVRAVRTDLERSGIPKPTSKQVKAELIKRFNEDEANRLLKHENRAGFVQESADEISQYFRKGNSPDGSLKFVSRMMNAIGALMVQQPTSAIRQTEQLFAPALKFGASKEVMQATGHGLKTFGSDAIGSLGQVIGQEYMTGSEDHRLTVKLNLHDPARVRDWHDAFDPIEGEGMGSRVIRTAGELTGFGLNRLGEKAQHTILRPAQIFTSTSMAIDRALTAVTWKLARIYSGYGMEFYKNNPDKLNDTGFKLDEKALGLKGASANSLRKFIDASARWHVDYDGMVRDALKRGDGTPFTDQEAMNLYSMGVSELSSESNPSTMPLGAYNNGFLRAISPLLGWPFRRAMDVLSIGKTPEGKHELAYLARGLAGIAVLAGGGLAVSMLANQYSQTFLGKKTNLRPVIGAPDPTQAALGVFENLARAGTLGLLGEVVNGAVNIGRGGDNRSILDVNQRVLALSAMNNVQNALTSFIHQGFTADYTHVIRPLWSTVGGTGMLQYLQLANNTLGFDNAESRLNARVSAQNWLRVVGRTLDMDVRPSSAGYHAPTPLSPALSRMELAAYGNDANDFRDAYAEAIQIAKAQGEDDPVAFVKRSFASRNPLRSVFSTSPTQLEYERLLNAMPDSGRQDVSEALRNFNSFAEQIGIAPFEGKQESKPKNITQLPRFSPNALRASAASRIGL